jgi:hypothetical protein
MSDRWGVERSAGTRVWFELEAVVEPRNARHPRVRPEPAAASATDARRSARSGIGWKPAVPAPRGKKEPELDLD